MEQSVKQRLIVFIKKSGLSQNRFENAVGVSNGYINNLRSSPKAPILQKIISAFPQLNDRWLLYGEGNMLKEETGRPQIAKTGKPYFNVDFEMGYDELMNDQTMNPDFMIDFKPYNKCDLWCNARGNSMCPTIDSGDVIALKEITDKRYVISGEIYAIVTDNGLRTIKRIIDNGNDFTLVPDNKEYPNQDIPKSCVMKIFKVLGAIKMF